jgi:hypothetical protein
VTKKRQQAENGGHDRDWLDVENNEPLGRGRRRVREKPRERGREERGSCPFVATGWRAWEGQMESKRIKVWGKWGGEGAEGGYSGLAAARRHFEGEEKGW